jgi:peroxiredoxin
LPRIRYAARVPSPTSKLVAALAAALALACGGDESSPSAPATAAAAAPAEAEPAPAPAPAPRPRRREKPLPNFSGWTLDGQKLSISSLIGRRLLIFFFNPDVADAPTVTAAVRDVAGLRVKHNFEIVGVAIASTREKAAAFARDQRIDFPVIDDSDGSITRQLGLRSPLLMLGVDSEGYVVFGITHFPTDEADADEVVSAMLRDALRLPRKVAGVEPELGTRPAAPPFRVEILDSDAPFDLAAHRGEPVLLIFFLHTCPHCHEALRALKQALAEMPEDQRPPLVGIEISGRTQPVRENLLEEKLDFFPVGFDHDGSIRRAYGSLGGVPDIVLIDAQGRIAERVRGWRTREDPPLMRMRLAQLAGAPVPMLLSAAGYSGNEVCGVCHERQHETWQFTQHATAYDTLVKHGAEQDPECIGCHVVGYAKAGGFVSASETQDLEDVGCESCHGRGGPHLSPDFVQAGDYAPACATCHDPKHSLGFEYATFLPRVSHAATAWVLDLPLEKKRERLAAIGQPRADLLPALADHVGSEACASCHPAEFETWAKSPHARAVETLVQAKAQGNEACLACHTTGFDRPGGFAKGARVADHPDLARVGCESCHGPGGGHVGEQAARTGTIVSLGDKCDSCVILQICGSCHDDANDPGFEFEVKQKIEAQRHGTIEAGTGRPLGKSARRADEPVPAQVARAFRLLAAGG